MIITWHGFSCFRLAEPRAGGEASLVTDPFAPEGSAKLPRNFSADLVTVSHDHARHNAADEVNGPSADARPFVIVGPGEYESKEFFVTGLPTFHDMVEGKEKGLNTMYRVNVGGLHLVHLGDLKHPLKDEDFEAFHAVDILFVPVGGGDVLTAKQAAELVAQVEPRIVIPMHYKADGIGEGLDGVGAFVKAMGGAMPEPLPKLKVTPKDLPQEETRIVILSPQ